VATQSIGVIFRFLLCRRANDLPSSFGSPKCVTLLSPPPPFSPALTALGTRWSAGSSQLSRSRSLPVGIMESGFFR